MKNKNKLMLRVLLCALALCVLAVPAFAEGESKKDLLLQGLNAVRTENGYSSLTESAELTQKAEQFLPLMIAKENGTITESDYKARWKAVLGSGYKVDGADASVVYIKRENPGYTVSSYADFWVQYNNSKTGDAVTAGAAYVGAAAVETDNGTQWLVILANKK